MPKLQIKTKREILRDIINAVVARTALSDVTDSSAFKHLSAAVAAEIAEVYYQFTILADLFDFRRAAGRDLDERAREILGATIARYEARRAVGQLEFRRAVATAFPVSIPAGTVVETADGVAVETTEIGTIAAGALGTVPFVDARAIEPGVAGNIGAGTAVRLRSRPAGVDTVSNPGDLAQGRDRESDDDFRARILAIIETLPRCTPDALAFVVLGLTDPAGSGKTIVFSHTFEDPNAPGTAVVYVDDGSGSIADYVAVPGVVPNTADSISAPVGVTQTLTRAGAFPAAAADRAALIGQYVAVTNTSIVANTGVFPITAVPNVNTVEYTNTDGAAGVEGAGAGFVVGEALTIGLSGPPGDAAVGGEEFLPTTYAAIVAGSEDLYLVRGGVVSAMTPDTVAGGDYDLRASTGLYFFAGTLGPLQTGDVLITTYRRFIGVIAEAQKVINGDRNDRLNYPGWRAAGVDVRVLPPFTRPQQVTVRLSVLAGYTRTSVIAAVRTAISQYINNLGISGDVVRHELVERIMGVPGVYDSTVSVPTTNIRVDDDEIARITALNIDVA